MITRIVKMTFQSDKVDQFLAVFHENKERIRDFPGCTYLELLQEKHQGQIFFTYSKWEKEEDLETYRKSKLFQTTWARTKVLFAEKPAAWTVNVEAELS